MLFSINVTVKCKLINSTAKNRMKYLYLTDYTLGIRGSSNISGAIDVKFMNISGRICADDWDDRDAKVACRELGFSRGKLSCK